ncbi:hypothetical protein GMMP15_260006 [Candidatus Magnetomoraceae bacterium gMMP-15]
MSKADIVTADAIYAMAKKETNEQLAEMQAELKDRYRDGVATGIFKTLEYQNAHNKMLKYATLYQIKKQKEYKKGGMTWDEFCQSLGESKANINKILRDMRPIYENASDKINALLGLDFSKIRFLGRSISENEIEADDEGICIEGKSLKLIPENSEAIEEAIASLKETQKRNLEEAKKKLKAKDRVIKQKNERIDNLDAQIAKIQADDTEKEGLTTKEKKYWTELTKMYGMMADFEARLDPFSQPQNMSKKMEAAYKGMVVMIWNIAEGLKNGAEEIFGDIIESTEEWVPEPLREKTEDTEEPN